MNFMNYLRANIACSLLITLTQNINGMHTPPRKEESIQTAQRARQKINDNQMAQKVYKTVQRRLLHELDQEATHACTGQTLFYEFPGGAPVAPIAALLSFDDSQVTSDFPSNK